MYWTFGVIYLVLTVFFVADVIRNPELTSGGKALWILALVFVPVLAWAVYGLYRIRQGRGLA
jgi:hypothetical protein